MKLNDNEKFVLSELLKDPKSNNTTLAKKLKITSQAIGKIRQKLVKNGVIKSQETIIDYNKLEMGLHAIALIKILTKAQKELKPTQIE